MSAELMNWALAGLTGANAWEMALYFLVATQVTMMTSTIYLHRCATQGEGFERG